MRLPLSLLVRLNPAPFEGLFFGSLKSELKFYYPLQTHTLVMGYEMSRQIDMGYGLGGNHRFIAVDQC